MPMGCPSFKKKTVGLLLLMSEVCVKVSGMKAAHTHA